MGNTFSRDSSFTQFVEKLPVAGHIAAGVHALAGNSEHAKRALATSTGSLITAAATVGGTMIGGPIGATLGAAAGSSLGLASEYGISTTIDDAEVKGNVGEVSLKRWAVDGGLSAFTAGVGAFGGKALVQEGAKAVAKEVTKSAAKGAATGVVLGGVTQSMINGISSSVIYSPFDQPPSDPSIPSSGDQTGKPGEDSGEQGGDKDGDKGGDDRKPPPKRRGVNSEENRWWEQLMDWFRAAEALVDGVVDRLRDFPSDLMRRWVVWARALLARMRNALFFEATVTDYTFIPYLVRFRDSIMDGTNVGTWLLDWAVAVIWESPEVWDRCFDAVLLAEQLIRDARSLRNRSRVAGRKVEFKMC